jgi:hypothetical protein
VAVLVVGLGWLLAVRFSGAGTAVEKFWNPFFASSNPARAIANGASHHFATPGTAFVAHLGGLYPAYVRGQAYLEAGKGQEAAVEFQKVIDHRGIFFADPIGALAHLQLGRSLASSGDWAKARSAYQDFLTLWKDADPDIPVFKRAKAGYAKVQKRE